MKININQATYDKIKTRKMHRIKNIRRIKQKKPLLQEINNLPVED